MRPLTTWLTMVKPSEKHDRWAAMIRTAAAIAILFLAASEFADKVGWW